MMETLAEISESIHGEIMAFVSPERRVTRNELLDDAMKLRESGTLIAEPFINGTDVISNLKLMIALDGYASAMFLIPEDMDDKLRVQIRQFANKVTKLRPGDRTNWILATSGTTGSPKLVSHNLQSLTRSLKLNSGIGRQLRWALLYDPCRFAGLQVTLQALLSGSVLLSPGSIDIEETVNFLKSEGCTSISATPSMWRKILSTSNGNEMKLRHITLGGEIADEKTLRRLRLMFKDANITHIYASTEAGVGFSVKDGKPGFPIEYLNAVPNGKVELKVSSDGTLLIRGQTFNQTYFCQSQAMFDSDGFINTGDIVEIRGDRVLFLGRSNGSINVGGQKVMPEAVESVIRSCPGVNDVRVYGKPSPILGMIVVAEVLPAQEYNDDELIKTLKAICQSRLEAFKRPAIIRIVNDIELTWAGKIKRR